MQDATKQEALRESRKALDLMSKSVLLPEEQQEVVADCVTNFDRYVNPGILEYRKSVSTDYTAVEWSDEGCLYRDIHGKEYIDCLGGFGIYMLGHRHPPWSRPCATSSSTRRCTPRNCSTPCAATSPTCWPR